MNIIKKIVSVIKKIFIKQEKVKELQKPESFVPKDKRDSYIKSLKITIAEKRTKKSVETLTCEGNGLRIKKKITY